MRSMRTVIVAAFMALATMPSAHASTTYAYWSYWQLQGQTWKYANIGPAMSPAVDGAVDGWRFTIASESRAQRPAAQPDFSAVCAKFPKQAGKARVALYIDYGSAGPAPRTICSVVDSGLSRASALGAVARLRLNNGFICAIDNYPSQGCGDAVPPTSLPASSTSPTPPGTGGSNSPLPMIVTIALAAIALLVAQRNARRQRGEQ